MVPTKFAALRVASPNPLAAIFDTAMTEGSRALRIVPVRYDASILPAKNGADSDPVATILDGKTALDTVPTRLAAGTLDKPAALATTVLASTVPSTSTVPDKMGEVLSTNWPVPLVVPWFVDKVP